MGLQVGTDCNFFLLPMARARSSPGPEVPPVPVPVRRGDFDGFWQFLTNFSRCRIANVLNTCSISRATHPPRPSCENLAEFAWSKIFYFIFQKRIKLTSAVGVTLNFLMGQYKHTNINLTAGIGSDWWICHVLKKYVNDSWRSCEHNFGRPL